MGKMNSAGFRSRIGSTLTVSITALSIFTSTFPKTAFGTDPLDVDASKISSGNMQKGAPDVESICASIENAQSGNFLGKDGSIATFTDPSCANLPRRQRNLQKNCQKPLDKEIAGLSEEDKKIKLDTLCAGDGLNEDAKTYCAIRAASADGQAARYCEAYKAAGRAKAGLWITLGLDVAAASACWLENRKLEKEFKATGNLAITRYDNYKSIKKGPCQKAAMVAGMAEFVQTAIAATNSRSSVKSDGSIKDPKAFEKVVGVAMHAGLSLKALQIGFCGEGTKGMDLLCKGRRGKQEKLVEGANSASQLAVEDKFKATAFRNDATKNLAQASNNKKATASALECANEEHNNARTAEVTECAKGQVQCLAATNRTKLAVIEKDKAKAADDKALEMVLTKKAELKDATDVETAASGKAKFQNEELVDAKVKGINGPIKQTHQGAILFSVMAAMRGYSLVQATSTQKNAKETLQSMFAGQDSVAAMGGGGVTNGNTAGFAPGAQSGFTSATGGGPNKNAAVAAGTPEAFLFPPGSEHGEEMKQLASQIPQSQLEKAAEGGAAGIAGLISAASGGDPGTASEIHAAVSTATTQFANMPGEDGGYAGGGGKMASKGDSGGGDGLNLKGLFGDGAKEEQAAASEDLAYRSLASDDIWHSKNPKGNNLFQIISDRYDTAQRNRGF